MPRWLDKALVIALAWLWLPLLAAIAFAVRVALGCPVLFVQERAGLKGRFFRLLKFRTMLSGDGADAQRVTPFGRFLRATSLDELPELFNVLKGEMALVGPRPLHVRYLPRYTAEQMRRHDVLPGITGWAQVNGRNAISWEQKFAYDVWYVEHRSAWLDLKILGLTLAKVAKQEGIRADGEETMGEFMGSSRVLKCGSSEVLKCGRSKVDETERPTLEL